jgi:hypothetical protein
MNEKAESMPEMSRSQMMAMLREQLEKLTADAASEEEAFRVLLSEAVADLPHPEDAGLELPLKALIVFKADGEVEVTFSATLKSAMATKATRRGSKTDLYALGFAQGEVGGRLVRTPAMAKHGGYESLDQEVTFVILDAHTIEGVNAEGKVMRGNVTGVARHIFGAGNKSGKYEPSLDGPMALFRDESSFVVRDGVKVMLKA